ncbi:MAG: hypothetical protein ACXWUG_07120 [Polyangiales bacterium]
MITTIRRAASLGLLSTLVGCAVQTPGQEGPVQEEKIGTQQEHLFGAAEINDCSSGLKSFVQKSINIGKFVAQTDEYKACVKANYISCDDDDDTSVSHLVSVTSSANPLKLACTDLGYSTSTGGTMGQTSYWCQHGYGYDGNETFDIDQTYGQQVMDMWNAGDFFGGFSMAGTIWHEAMHVHGYQHGNSSADTAAQQALDNASSCGRDPSSWFWRANSAPYDVGFCMVGAYTRKGSIGRSGTLLKNDDGDPGAAARNSIVDAYYANAHKWLSDPKRTDTFNRIAGGTLTSPAALKLEAAGNSLFTQPSSLTFNGGAGQDKLFDAQDQEYWQVTIPTDDRLRVDVSIPYGAPKPTLSIHRVSYGTLQNVTTPAAVASSTTISSSLEQDLKAGTYLVHVKAAAGTSMESVFISASSAPAPKAPTSCSGFINCLGHVHVTCADEAESLVLERASGYFWTSVTEDDDRNRSSVDLVDDAPVTGGGIGRTAYATYRVCSKSYGKTSCGPSFTVNITHQACYDQYDCDHQPIFQCFNLPGEESFCCHDKPAVPVLIPIPTPLPIPEVIATH